MHFPRLPDWLAYLIIVVALTVAAIGRQEQNADAPPPPPPVPGEEGMPLGPLLAIRSPSVVVHAPDGPGPDTGTAFAVADNGVWLTARHVVEGCSKAAIVVAEGRGVAVKVHITPGSEAAVLTTEGGAQPALPLGLERPLKRGARAFSPGFPQGHPGEITTCLLGRENLLMRGRGARTEPVLVWAEVGRTQGLTGSLSGILRRPDPRSKPAA